MNNPFDLIDARLANIETLLIDLKFPSKQATETEQLLTIGQAAELLSLTTPTIYGLIHKKVLPHSKKGKRLYFSKLELLEWVKSGRKKTIAECQANPESHLRTPKRRATA